MGSENKGKKNLVSLSSGPRRGSSKPGVTGRSHVHETVCYFLAGVFVSYRFDVYRKVPKDLTEPTLTGAVSKFFFPILILEYSAPFSLLNFLQGPQVSCNQHRWGGEGVWNGTVSRIMLRNVIMSYTLTRLSLRICTINVLYVFRNKWKYLGLMLSDLSSYVKYQQLIWNILYSGTIFLSFLTLERTNMYKIFSVDD